MCVYYYMFVVISCFTKTHTHCCSICMSSKLRLSLSPTAHLLLYYTRRCPYTHTHTRIQIVAQSRMYTPPPPCPSTYFSLYHIHAALHNTGHTERQGMPIYNCSLTKACQHQSTGRIHVVWRRVIRLCITMICGIYHVRMMPRTVYFRQDGRVV